MSCLANIDANYFYPIQLSTSLWTTHVIFFFISEQGLEFSFIRLSSSTDGFRVDFRIVNHKVETRLEIHYQLYTAINVDALCQEGAFLVDNISFYSDAAVGTELTAEADWKRRGLYIGPQFDTLDVSVQEEFEAWLKERGVNEALASFVPEYAEWKEQKVRSHLFRMFSMLTANHRSMSAGSSR